MAHGCELRAGLVGRLTGAHGYWYRVVTVNDDLVGTMELEVQQTFSGFPANSANIPGTVLVCEGVVEVYERGTGR